MPFSHQLPVYLSGDGYYDALIPRVTTFIRAREGPICGIDVGANIGDTILAAFGDSRDQFLAVEPNPEFFEYLGKNVAEIQGVRLSKAVCGAMDGQASYSVATAAGTARFEKSASYGTAMECQRLDTLVLGYSEFSRCNFLKIDTDGHDFEVLRGARKLIAAAMPVILFECDIFKNSNYVEDVLDALRFFASVGYKNALVYDNGGYLFGHLDLSDVSSFSEALFYQMINGRFYFDVLVMRDAGSFLAAEMEFFIKSTPTPECRAAAEQSAKLTAERLRLREASAE